MPEFDQRGYEPVCLRMTNASAAIGWLPFMIKGFTSICSTESFSRPIFPSEIIEKGVKIVLLNHGTTLVNLGEKQATAVSSAASYLDNNSDGKKDEQESEGPFPVATAR